MLFHEKDKLPIFHFELPSHWEEWLVENHEITEKGIWLRFYKKNSGVATIVYAQALDVALCYGWIDAVANKYDDLSYLQKFTPRRKRSIWSKRNIEHVERLISEGRMQPAGLRQIEAAKADGRWDQAYDSPANMEIPADFLEELAKDPSAKAFFDTLNKTNLYAIGWRLQTAKKPETRAKRMKAILEMLSKGEKFH
ncbi:MAG TPA: YdeI/OmpD-associated family protein [Flavilitoribacter sp.]|nr:YdeI/OmpD-associated family protein [Flavilitoribacter sp.]